MKLRSKYLHFFPFTFQDQLGSKCISISVLPGSYDAAGEDKQGQTNVEKHFGNFHSFKYPEMGLNKAVLYLKCVSELKRNSGGMFLDGFTNS